MIRNKKKEQQSNWAGGKPHWLMFKKGRDGTSMRLEPRRDTTCIMLWPSWRVKVCSSAALFRFFLPPFMDPLPSQVPFLCNSATMGVRPSLQTILSHLLRLVFCLPCANSERSAIQNFDCFHFSFNSQQTNKQFNIKKNRDQVTKPTTQLNFQQHWLAERTKPQKN